MIVDLPTTSVEAVNKKLIQLREDVGAMALGRVLTLVMVVAEHDVDHGLEVAQAATRQHPSRIVCVARGNERGTNRIDAQIRVGGDAGASEMVVLRLYGELTAHAESVVLPLLLADSPVVVWWPCEAPVDVGRDPIGKLGQRRITDAEHSGNPPEAIAERSSHYTAGDTDLVWTRTTKWRGLLAAALDQPPYEKVTSITVTGGTDSAASDMLAGWLATYLDAPVLRARTPAGTGIVSVRLERDHGNHVDLVRPDGGIATLDQSGQPVRRLALARRSDAECLADELARLDPDEVYHRTLVRGLARLDKGESMPASEAVSKGLAPSAEEAKRQSERLAREAHTSGAAAMISRPEPPTQASSEAVHEKAVAKLDEVHHEVEEARSGDH